MRTSRIRALVRNEDWLSILIGLSLIALAAAVFAAGGSIKWLAVAPQKWSRLSEAGAQLARDAPRYASLLVVWAALFGAGAAGLGGAARRFLPAFFVIFITTGVV
jgi:hypothetical protein